MADIAELHRLNAEATPGPWRCEIKYGPENESNYAWVYTANDELVGTFKIHHAALIVAMRNSLPELLAKAEAHDALVEALTPSAETKSDYIGEFCFFIDIDMGGPCEVSHKVVVPWTTTKEIMKAITTRAALAKLEGRYE